MSIFNPLIFHPKLCANTEGIQQILAVPKALIQIKFEIGVVFKVIRFGEIRLNRSDPFLTHPIQ